MAIVLKDVWPNRGSDAFTDTWKDTEVRANADRAAKVIESGVLTDGYWGTENVQVGENESAGLAAKEAGAVVRTSYELGD